MTNINCQNMCICINICLLILSGNKLSALLVGADALEERFSVLLHRLNVLNPASTGRCSKQVRSVFHFLEVCKGKIYMDCIMSTFLVGPTRGSQEGRARGGNQEALTLPSKALATPSSPAINDYY